MLFGSQFNSAIFDVLGLGATPNRSLLFRLDQTQKKNLTGFAVSNLVPDSSIYAATIPDTFGQIVICTGNLDTDAFGVTLPITIGGVTLIGMQRLIFAYDFKNGLTMDFSSPITVEPDETLNVLVGQGFQQGAALSVAPLITTLSIKGFMGERESADFPYRLR